ncbi:uncharacterized protein [Miscanthus floridulus]|uniref:uncharacterized protein n=1 Tax=Miscanthus floridulus TaxID=154761 RepID=UPI0034573FC1
MPPRGRKHWCKLCRKSFTSYMSLGGHMNLHSSKRKQKKLSSTAPSLANTRGGAGGYGLWERRHSTWLLCDSSDDEYLTPVPKTECQLCFKARGALGMHMRAHIRRERKMVAEEVPRESDGYCDHNVPVSTPVTLTYGMEEVNALRVLMTISGHSGMDTAYEHCGEDYEMDGNLAYLEQKSEMELDYSGHRQTGDAELMPESCISDVKLKFISLSHVLKATASHDCKLCGKVFTSSKGLASHKKFHKVHDHEKVAASPNSAMPETGKQLLEVDSQLLCLDLSGLSDRNHSGRSPRSELTPWWTKRGLLLYQSVDKKL